MVWAGPAGSPDSLAVASGSIIPARGGPHKAKKPLAARSAGGDLEMAFDVATALRADGDSDMLSSRDRMRRG